MSLPHETRSIQVWVDADIGVADMVVYLNTISGVRTLASCQGTIGEGGPAPFRAQVMATWTPEAFERLSAEFDISYPEECDGTWGYIHPREGWKAVASRPVEAQGELISVVREVRRLSIQARNIPCNDINWVRAHEDRDAAFDRLCSVIDALDLIKPLMDAVPAPPADPPKLAREVATKYEGMAAYGKQQTHTVFEVLEACKALATHFAEQDKERKSDAKT